MRLNVIVPCYNPPEDWEAALAQRFVEFQKSTQGLVSEVGLIVVNDGSPRNATKANFDRLRHFLPQVKIVSYEKNHGKGYALRKGVEASDADFHLATDADFPYTLESMKRIVQSLLDYGGVAAGNRDFAYYDKVPAFRRRLSKMLRWVLRNLLRQPIDDSQCGLKGFDNHGKGIFLKTTIKRFLFDLEFLMLANEQVRVIAVPVELREGVTFSKVGWKILVVEAANLFRLLLRR